MSEFGRRGSRKYYLCYTLLFAVLTGISLSWFLLRGKAFIWSYDGVIQHYNALAYYGKYLREIFLNLWKHHRLIIPSYDFSIGYGADILTTLHYYAIGEPLNLLSVFVPARYTEYLYEGLVIVRMYLAGLSFSWFARGRLSRCSAEYADFEGRHLERGILLGSVVYLFSEYVLYYFCRHPFFLTPMIYLPLLLMGVDRIYENKRGTLYICMIALSALSNFYFFYMLGIFTVIYAVFSYFSYFRFSLGRVCGLLLKFCLFTLLGMGIAAVILLPAVQSALGTARLENGAYVPVLYELRYYIQLFPAFISVENPGFQTYLGYPAAAFFAVILLFVQKKRGILKAGFVCLTMFLLVPFFGHMFNGFSYAANRWVFGYTLLAAFIVARMYPFLAGRLPVKTRKLLLLFTGLELLACVAVAAAKLLMGYSVRLGMTGCSLAALLLLAGLFVLVPAERKRTRTFFCLVTAITVCSVGVNAFDIRNQRIDETIYADAGTVQASLADVPSAVLKEYKSDSAPWRYGEQKTGEEANSALQTGLYGTSFYFSVANPCIAEFRSALYLNELLDHSYQGMDGRSILEMFSGVKYFVAPKSGIVPAGYQNTREFSRDGKEYAIFARGPQVSQPFLLGYDRVVPRETFDKLSVEQKQQILFDAMVCEDEDELPAFCTKKKADVPKVKLSPTKIVCKKNCSLKGNALHVKKAGARVVLESKTDRTGEVYVVAEGIEFEKKSRGGARLLSGSLTKGVDKVDVSVLQGKKKKRIRLSGDKERQGASSRNNFVCNLGTQSAGKKKITLKFPKAGTYRFEDLRISLQPTAKLAQRAAGWNEGISGTMSVRGDRVTADLTLARDRLVCLAIPYDRGWSLEVDGHSGNLIRGNIMYCAVPLKAGQHTLKMRYRNPYIRLAAAISALSMLIFVIYLWRGAKKDEK